MLYFGFRFCIEFLKPNVFFVFGLSMIPILCVVCWVYYLKASPNLPNRGGTEME
ncbi:prolipoprotein diacylglyceryl transferase [Hyunsoonleella ulvae]|uniref:prolipoprotein diacylglyceryl transferase n=1 Tax=Hyunsoonleella ulvae TaxID=2799948 RepID=UPI001EF07A65|nr:prolipoprotein diacylglyceryl transferase [Hyunsoonleella ulvae]